MADLHDCINTLSFMTKQQASVRAKGIDNFCGTSADTPLAILFSIIHVHHLLKQNLESPGCQSFTWLPVVTFGNY